MNFTIEKDILLKAVSIADSAVSSKNINTSLGYCLINIYDNFLTISGTDNDIAIRHKCDVISDGNFSFIVNGKKVIQIIKELPKGEIDISVDSNFGVSIKSRSKDVKGVFKVIGSENIDYPVIPDFDDKKSFSFDQNKFKEMIRKVSYAASNDSIKPAFNGVYIVSEKSGFLSVVASDSRRLSISSDSVNESFFQKEGIIVPLKTVNEIMKILSSGEFLFYVNENQCFFKIGNTEIISRIIDGQFPNYKQVIPKDYSLKIYIPREKLIETIRRILVFTKEPSYKVVLSFSKEKVLIESKTAELGEASEYIDIESNLSDKIVIGINAQYVLDAVKELESPVVECGINGPMNPVTFSPEGDGRNLAIIMPIQIKSADSE